jgi:hypothetical protein
MSKFEDFLLYFPILGDSALSSKKSLEIVESLYRRLCKISAGVSILPRALANVRPNALGYGPPGLLALGELEFPLPDDF